MGEIKPRDNALRVKSVDRVSRVALGGESRTRLNLDRLRQRVMAAIEEEEECVGFESPFSLFSCLPLLLN